MKKKIINGFLMAAMLLTATTSFVSCKDNVDDELVLVYKDLAKVENDLKARLSDLEGKLATLQTQVDQNKADIANLKTEMENVKTEINNIKTQLTEINAKIEALDSRVTKVEEDLDKLTKRVDALENEMQEMENRIYEAINKIVVDVNVNHTVNRVFGSLNFPGVNSLALATLYGENTTGIKRFPVTGLKFNVYPDDDFHFVDKDEIGEVYEFKVNKENIITDDNYNAGKIFFTVNTPGMSKKNFDYKGFELSMENSNGRVAPLVFTNPVPSKYLIHWGFFKTQEPWLSDTATEEVQENGLFESDVTLPVEAINDNSFGVKTFIDFKTLQSDFKQAIEHIKAAQGATSKAVAIAKEAAQLLQNVYKRHMSGYGQDITNPTWFPHQLVMSKTVDGITYRTQSGDYNVAITAVKPMSYNSFYEFETKAAKHVSFQRLESAIARIAEKIKEKTTINVGNVTFKEINADGILINVGGGKTYLLAVNNNTAAYPGAGGYIAIKEDLITPLVNGINEGMPIDQLNELIQNLGKVNSLGTSVTNYADRLNSYIEAFGNKIVSALNSHQMTRALAPCIFFEGSEGIDRLQDGLTIKHGVMAAYMSSPTEELLAPAFKKFICVKRGATPLKSEIFDGSTQKTLIDLSVPGEYTIVFSAVDYYGYVCTKRYKLHVE